MVNVAAAILHLYPHADLSPEGTVLVTDDGTGAAITKWDNTLGPMPTEAALIEATAQMASTAVASTEAMRVESLWQAAHDYECAQISGSAIGLLAMGVMQGKPKCIAVQNWIKSIWTAYYERKATGSTDNDFSVAGECPHTVPELMVELGL